MWNIPILRSGRAYYSKESLTLRDYATGQPVAEVSQANAGLVSRDLLQDAWTDFQGLATAEILDRLGGAAKHFLQAAPKRRGRDCPMNCAART